MVIKAISKTECLQCGICIKVCPNDVLRQDKEGYPFIAYREDCSACRMCEERCALEAITVLPHAARKFSETFAMRHYLAGLGLNITMEEDEVPENPVAGNPVGG